MFTCFGHTNSQDALSLALATFMLLELRSKASLCFLAPHGRCRYSTFKVLVSQSAQRAGDNRRNASHPSRLHPGPNVISHPCPLWSPKPHPRCVPISLKIELYIFSVEKEQPFVFGRASATVYTEHPNNAAHGYTQPSQPLPVFTSSATVSGDPATVPRLNKRKRNPTIRTWKPRLESMSFQGIRL